MRRALLAIILAAAPVPAAAAKVVASNNAVDQVSVAFGAVGSEATPVDLLHPLPVADATLAPRRFGESSSAASFTFAVTTQATARGWFANCPAGTTTTVTLVSVGGGSAPRTLYDGWQDNDDVLQGYSGNIAGCTIGARL